ncbi:MAG: GLUG motif-containing protein, partial [Rikenellaceae bacterium]
MKRFALHFALVVVAALGAFSCQKSDLQQGVSLGSYSLFARVVDTKIEFTNNTSEGIYLDWELGDTFSVYAEDDGSYVGDYYCVDTDLEAFSPKAGVTLTSGAAYTAIYPAVDNSDGELSLDDARARDLTSVQNGDAIANLDAACYMEGSFTYSSESDITVGFEHQMAVMSFTFISAQRPDHLIFDNGSDSYTVNYSTISPTITNSEGNDYYTSHIMIEPCEAAERTLCFALYDSDGELYDYRIVTTSKAYEAGVRYTAPVSDLLPWLGSGTESDPYQISNADQLRQLSTNVNAGNQYSGEYFIMTTSIDLGFDDPAWRYGTDSTYFEKAENKFTPIGNSEEVSFRGTFDGGGYEVSGLYVDEAGGYAGLFGYVYGATIKNLGVTGVISGTKNVGGIVGYGFGPVTIENCYNKALVSSGDGGNLGGILGYVLAFNSYGSIINCYNSREVSSSGSNVGGIVGYSSYCNVTNCYNRGEISSSSDNVGGIVGYGDNLGTISICYNSAEVSGGDNVGSILGTRKYSSGLLMTTVTNCYYLELDSSSDDCAEEVSDQRMKSADFVVDLNNLVYTYNQSASTKAYGWAQVTDSYPVLDPSVEVVYTYDLEYDSSTDTYLIHNEYGLKAFADLVNGNANTCDATVSGPSFGIAIPSINGLLTADIDLSAICSSSEGNWEPIGKSTSVLFSGTFDGGGYSISGLYIDASSSSNLGLFGCVGAYGVVKNISISGNITGFKDVGGLAGVNNGTIINCYNNAWVTGTEYIGGIVGWNFGAITNCYDISGYISGKSSVGGIVGCNQGGVVTNCYKSSSLMANSTGGGIVGYMYSGTVTNCYYDCSWTYGYG